MKKGIVSVVGKDRPGIIYPVCRVFSETNNNILEIAQKVIGGYFNMMMIVDLSESTKDLDTLQKMLEKVGIKIGVKITLQLEDIFTSMHRI